MTEEMWMLDPIAEELDKACDVAEDRTVFGEPHTLLFANSDGIEDWDEEWSIAGSTNEFWPSLIQQIRDLKVLSFRRDEEVDFLDTLKEHGWITIAKKSFRQFSDSDL